MNTHYLKSIKKRHYQKVMVKVTDKKTVTIWNTKIEVEDVESDSNALKEVDWYKGNWGMEGCSKQEFDEFYIEVANEINESINE